MMSILLVLGLVAYSSASECCSYGDIQIVQAQWNDVWNTADSAAAKLTLGAEIFRLFFEVDEASKVLFQHLNVEDIYSPEFSGHIMRVMTGFDIIVSLLGDAALDSELDHLNAQHLARVGVQASHFKEMFNVIEGALSLTLEDFDRLAWRFCFRGVSDGLTRGLPE